MRTLPIRLAMASLLAAGAARADSAAARCELVPARQRLPVAVHACVFSQRQGVVGVQVDADRRHDFVPVEGRDPGAYTDAQGRPVRRLASIKGGAQFRLADGRLLRVLWGAAPLDSTLALQGIRFRLQSANTGSSNTLRVTPAGLQIDNRPQQLAIDGTITGAELADLDGDGSPELYVASTAAGSGSHGTLTGLAVNKRKSLSFVMLDRPAPDAPQLQGHQGHDRFLVDGNRLVWRFPVYRPGDPNAAPGGGTRALRDRLSPGEAGWLLRLDGQADRP
ncbi:MAG TPA: PliI family lysozyme inhibitor of I-type lysozyme [Aquabacterium sp.]|nr:PliI family lysozyme inhibitor of I-type lysozyme [Aquabacterium sp.]